MKEPFNQPNASKPAIAPRLRISGQGRGLADSDRYMAKRKLKVGDIVKVIEYRPGKYAPGVKDELGTEKLFKSMVGKRYRIEGFDNYGHLELRPKMLHTVWIEADLVELAAAGEKGRNITQRPSRRFCTSPSKKRSARRG